MTLSRPLPEVMYSPEAYLQREQEARIKLEYFNGRITPMAGGTASHNKISARMITALVTALDNRPFEVYTSDMKIHIPEVNTFVYPDAVVVALAPAFYEGRQDILTNPLLVVEVSSPSSEAYDRSLKFDYYRHIPSFQEYVVVSQDRPHVSVYTREAVDLWRMTDHPGLEGDILLRCIETRIRPEDIYKGITFG
ncbi:MAG: Uma2 family endonuclease [Bacteroidia bacterium]|nr:Uma2 family endonuclease [Bacteroidia bacterium]